MRTRRYRRPALLLLRLTLVAGGAAGCTSGPTEGEIISGLEEELRSVVGEWTAVSTTAPGALTLEFALESAGGTAVRGAGTMREGTAGAPIAISVTGTYVRPVLTLAFTGMVFEGRAVNGQFSGRYTTVGGISDAMVLTGADYSRSVPMLFQER